MMQVNSSVCWRAAARSALHTSFSTRGSVPAVAILRTIGCGEESARVLVVAARRHSTGTRTWVPPVGEELEKAVAKSLVHTLVRQHTIIADQVVPWYLNNFPASYFIDVGESTRSEHLKGITALKAIDQSGNQNISLTLTSNADDQSFLDITVMRNGSQPGTLHNMLTTMEVEGLQGLVLHRVKAYTSKDESMTLNIFTYGPASEEPASASVADAAAHLEELSATALGGGSSLAEKEVLDYIQLCQPSYVRTVSTRKLLVQRELYMKVAGTENVEVHVDCDPLATLPAGGSGHRMEAAAEAEDPHVAWVSIAASNCSSTDMLSKVTALMLLRGMTIVRMFLDKVRDTSTQTGDRSGSVSLIRVLAKPAQQSALPPGVASFPAASLDCDAAASLAWQELKHDLKRVKWLDAAVLELALMRCPGIGMERAEILTAFCALLHGPLHKINPHAFSRQGLMDIVSDSHYRQFVIEITDLFLARFKPDSPMGNEPFRLKVADLRSRLQGIQDESGRLALLKMVDAVEATLRTNLYVPDRYALALRLNPKLMVGHLAVEEMQPFGVFFVHGQAFDGFHNRFSHIARGGLRIVSPASTQQFAAESARCYDEAYALSRAQELKNKDIPEGGAKAVILVDTTSKSGGDPYHTKRNAVKAFTNAILDLIVPCEEVRSKIVDHLGFEELVYLGPDEQVVPSDINWIIQHAKKRGYPMASAFMSSKPRAGINHKVYGVTSEGVVVFLDVALRAMGLDPKKQPFSVKLTGGPDGDVAGNLLRILFRDYGENARIVGIADGSGCAEDPNGLPHDELLRLFHAELPIAHLDRRTLSETGLLATAETAEGIELRNSMHNRVKADVFVPAGGRPNTIHAGNWRSFLDPTLGKPSSPLIVEGANIFITKEARACLHDNAGVRIVKDSSANKCGVITSSYEICASMLLDEQEFLEIKDELVADVLERLRQLARLEAELMFCEFRNYPGAALPSVSEHISQSILRAKAAILEHLQGMRLGDETYNKLLELFMKEHLPAKLVSVAGDRISDRIPLDYLRCAFASCLASRLLYREGIHFLDSQPSSSIPELALSYLEEEGKIEQLVESVGSASSLDEALRREVMHLLRRGGVRSSLNVY